MLNNLVNRSFAANQCEKVSDRAIIVGPDGVEKSIEGFDLGIQFIQCALAASSTIFTLVEYTRGSLVNACLAGRFAIALSLSTEFIDTNGKTGYLSFGFLARLAGCRYVLTVRFSSWSR